MPGRTEIALFTIGIIRDDIDRGNLHIIIHRDMIVGDISSGSIREVGAETNHLGSSPYLINDLLGILLGHSLLIEAGSLSAHHIQQDTVAGIVVRLMRVLRPILCSQGPTVTVVLVVVPLWCSPVFCIEADKVDAHLQGISLFDDSRKFYHHGHATGTVVGGNYGCAVIFLVGIVISPGPTIPMGT